MVFCPASKSGGKINRVEWPRIDERHSSNTAGTPKMQPAERVKEKTAVFDDGRHDPEDTHDLEALKQKLKNKAKG